MNRDFLLCTAIGMMQKKIAEAEAAFASGMKAEKAGVSCGFWGRMVGGGSVDWDLAAADYERAATGFKVAKEHSRAIDAFERAAHAQGNLSEGEFMASKHLESAAFLALELKRHAAAASLYEQSATVHLTVCRIDSAAAALIKAAKALEASDGAQAAEVASRACELLNDLDDEPKLRQGVESIRSAINLLIRLRKLPQACAAFETQAAVCAQLAQPHGVARAELSLLLLRLFADDFEGASNGYERALREREADEFAARDEAALAERILSGFRAQDEKALAGALGDPLIHQLEMEAARLARTLTLRSAGVPHELLDGPKSSVGQGSSSGSGGNGCGGSTASGTGDFGEAAPEDELTDDLC